MGWWAPKLHRVAELFLILQVPMHCFLMFHRKANWSLTPQQSSPQLQIMWQSARTLRQVSQLLLTFLGLRQLLLVFQGRRNGHLIVQH